MRVKLCVPHYLQYDFVKPSLTRLLEECTEIEWVDGIRSGAVITILRNRIVTNYLAPSCDYRTCFDRRYTVRDCDALFWVDSDIRFEPSDFRRLLEHIDSGKLIISGLYPSRVEEREYVAGWWLPKQPGAIGRCIREPEGGLIEVDWIGAGFCLVSARLYEQIEQPWYENVVQPFDGGTKVLQLSEDLGFCHKLNRAGIPIHVDRSIVVEHQPRWRQANLKELREETGPVTRGAVQAG